MKYNEVVFVPSVADNTNDNSIPELWFARENYVLDDAFSDSNENVTEKICNYYPNLESSLDLGYLSNNNKVEKVDGRIFKGLIQLPDKVILLINQNEKRNITAQDTYNIIKHYGFDCNVIENSEPVFDSCDEKHKKI